MRHRPLISVIIPVYNAGPYLRRCASSLLAQTYEDFELILVDDGSTDGSGDICEALARASAADKVSVVHQPNSGVSAARNRGIDAARGTYLSFVDADDWVEPTFLQTFAEEVERLNGDVDMVLQGYINHEGEHIQEPKAEYRSAGDMGAVLHRLEEKRLMSYVWNKVVRRTVVQENDVRFHTDVPIGEDFLFCMEAVSHCHSLSVLPELGYHYFYPPGDHKDYPFEAWNRRLDYFAELLPTMRMLPDEVSKVFLAKEFKMALYVLRIAYHECLPRAERLAYLRKIKPWGKGNEAVQLRRYEKSFLILAILVLYVPAWLSDALLMTLRKMR